MLKEIRHASVHDKQFDIQLLVFRKLATIIEIMKIFRYR